LIGRGVPVWVEENETIRPDKVETATSGLAAQKEDEFGSIRVVELVNELLALGYIHGAVEAEAAVIAGAAESLEDVEGLSVVADEDDLVVCVLTNSC